MLSHVIRRWQDQPVRLRGAVLVIVLLLVFGTCVHIVHLVQGGLDPYPSVPGWLAVYFVSLTVLDPLAALLLARRRLSGVVLAVVVFVTDAVANGFANYTYDATTGVTVGRVGQAFITVLAAAVCVSAPAMWRAARQGLSATS